MIDDLVEVLIKLKETDVAHNLLCTLGKHANNFIQLDLIAKNLFILKKYKEAEYFAKKCFEYDLSPMQKEIVKQNLINIFIESNYPEEALKIIETMEDKKDSTLRLKESYCLFLNNQREESQKILLEELKNENLDEKTKLNINFNLNVYEFDKGNFQGGLYRFLIYGKQLNYWNKPSLPFKVLNESYKKNDILILRSEAGIGDEFINVRFMRHFENLGLKPIWLTERKDISSIFNRNNFLSITTIDEVKELWNGEEIYWCHSMDSPLILKLDYKDLWNGPYIKPNEKPSNIKSDKIKIGIKWQGNPTYANDLHRSLSLDEIYNVLKQIDCQIYSLQKEENVDELKKYSDIIPLHEFSLQTFEETLTEIRDLDLIVTSCTSIAHAAAAMGKKTVVFVPISKYYIWCGIDNTCSWYDKHVKVLKQTKPRCWNEPMKQLKEFLKNEFTCN
jgi:hypothetical protein